MKTSAVRYLAAVVIITAAFQLACDSDTEITGPTPPPDGNPANVTISIVATSGAQSFQPATITVQPGQTIAFRNNDSVVHRILQNQGAFDTGNLNPGQTSAPITISTSSALPYHCTLHPDMVGAINSSTIPGPGEPGYE